MSRTAAAAVLRSEGAPLVILAGGGRFPVLVAKAAHAAGRRVAIAAIRGEADPAIEVFEHEWIGRGHFGRLLRLARRIGAREVVMIGGMRQRRMPGLSEFDFVDLWVVLRNWSILSHGDDGLLRRLARLFEASGLTVVGADAVAPELVVAAGPLGAVRPDAAALADVAAGLAAAREHGRADRGQGVVVEAGAVLAQEGASGTDAMVASLAAARSPEAPRRGILVKCPKPIQDRRLDLPAIGPDTVRTATAAGLRGIAVEAGGALVADREETIRLADAAGLFVYGFSESEEGS